MTLDDGASWEINSRWPTYKQRNCALNSAMYPNGYCGNLMAGIQLVRDHHEQLQLAGATDWFITPTLKTLLDELAGVQSGS